MTMWIVHAQSKQTQALAAEEVLRIERVTKRLAACEDTSVEKPETQRAELQPPEAQTGVKQTCIRHCLGIKKFKRLKINGSLNEFEIQMDCKWIA